MSINALIRWLKPRETVFFDLLEGSAANLVEMTRVFSKGMETGNVASMAELRKEIKALEHKGDSFTHDTVDHLDRTFVTPIEREDILALAHALDDVADCIDAAAERLVLYKPPVITPIAKDMARLLVEGAEQLQPLVGTLRSMNNVGSIRKRIQEMSSLENQSDALYHAALAELFENPTDPIFLMKWKEIYGQLEDAMDQIDRVAKVVGSTVMRNA